MLLLSAWPWAVQMIASHQGLLSLETFCQLSQCPLESIYIYIYHPKWTQSTFITFEEYSCVFLWLYGARLRKYF